MMTSMCTSADKTNERAASRLNRGEKLFSACGSELTLNSTTKNVLFLKKGSSFPQTAAVVFNPINRWK